MKKYRDIIGQTQLPHQERKLSYLGLKKSPFIKRFFLGLLITFFTVVFLFSLLYTLTALASKTIITEFFLSIMPQQHLQGVNILVYGIDQTKITKRADSIMVCHLDLENNKIGVLSIPRDTRVNIPGHAKSKLNHAYAYGGTDLLKTTVSNFLNIPIDYYIHINLAGVEQFIDELGGIAINVQKDLHYVDQAGDLFIDIKKGEQVLNGKQAVQFLRYRHDQKGDIGRIARQQSFLKAIGNSTLNANNILQLPFLISKLNKNILTNLSTKEILQFATLCKKAFLENKIETATVPGAIILHKGISYWRPDIISLDRLIQNLLLGFNQPPSSLSISNVQTIDSQASKENRRKLSLNEISRIMEQTDERDLALSKLDKTLCVEILNGYGKAGEAQILAHQLKDKLVKITRIGNAQSYDYRHSLIVDWKGNIYNSMALAQALSIDPTRIIIYNKPDKPLDLTLVLGQDWDELKQNFVPKGASLDLY